MRTTLDIADDAVRRQEIAQRERKSLGTVISELARRAPSPCRPRLHAPAGHAGSGREPLAYGSRRCRRVAGSSATN